MSSGSPIRPRGFCFLIISPKRSSVAFIIWLSNGPGAIAFTVTCSGASLRASTRVMWCSPAFAAEYA